MTGADRDRVMAYTTPLHSVKVEASLPWERRERVDWHTRRSITELRKLAVEDPAFALMYETMADTFEAAVELIGAVEDAIAGAAS